MKRQKCKKCNKIKSLRFKMSNIRVFGLAGKKQSGKDSAVGLIAGMLCGVPTQTPGPYMYEKISLADPLKQFCMDWFGLHERQCYGTDDDKNTMTDLKNPLSGDPMSARETLQVVGTDIFRAMDPDIWVKRARIAVDEGLKKNHHIFVPDIRFPNELKAFQERDDTITIKLERLGYKRDDEHISEKALDDLEDSNYNYVVRATNIEQLKVECQKILQDLNLL